MSKMIVFFSRVREVTGGVVGGREVDELVLD